MAATPAIAAAEQAGIVTQTHAYEHDPKAETHAYEHDPKAESYGLEAADKLGVEPGRVFKTLVASVGGTLQVAIVPVAAQLDLKALGKRAELARAADAERATGYVTGGISPLGQRRRLPTVVDVSALDYDTVFVSAGRRGVELELDPRDLVRLTGARVAAIASAR